MSRKKGHMLYDGDCGVCTWAAGLAEKIDGKKQAFVIRPFQRYKEQELDRYGLTGAMCARKLHVVTPDGKIRTGALAVNAFMMAHFPWSILAVLTCILFPLLLLQMLAYRIISRNRHTISRWLGLTACAYDPGKPVRPARAEPD